MKENNGERITNEDDMSKRKQAFPANEYSVQAGMKELMKRESNMMIAFLNVYKHQFS